MIKQFRLSLWVAVGAILLSVFKSTADDWQQYLGPRRDGIWREAGVQLDIETHPPRLVWSTPIDSGYTGPSVADGRVFVMDRQSKPFEKNVIPGANLNFARAEIEGTERVLCLDEITGDILWTHSYEASYSSVFPYAIGPRASPLIHDDLVYTLGAEGHLYCCDAKSGSVVWKRNFVNDYGLEVPDWGTASHPLIFKDLIICMVGGNGTTVVAFDKKSGEEKWRALSAKEPGYGTPVIENVNGNQQLLVWHAESVNGIDPNTGQVYWTVPFKPEYGMAIGAPRVWKDLVYVMGFNAKAGTIRVSKDGLAAEKLWGPHPKLGVAGVFNTAYIKDGFAYSGGRRGMFRCIKIETGERVWEDTRPLLKADGSGKGPWQSAFTVHHEPSGKTLIFNDHGELIVSTLTPEGYEESGRSRIIEPTHTVAGRLLIWSHPALANGRIYCRNDREIRCFDLRRSNRNR